MGPFAEALKAGVEPHTPGGEGLQDMKLIAAIDAAVAGGGTVKMAAMQGLDASRGPAPKEEG